MRTRTQRHRPAICRPLPSLAVAAACALAIEASVQAGFTGLSTTYTGTFAGVDVYQVSAHFDGSYQVLSVLSHTLTAGTNSAIHADAGGSWDPSLTPNFPLGASQWDTMVLLGGAPGAQSGLWVTQSGCGFAGCGTMWPESWTSTSTVITNGSILLMQVGLNPGSSGWMAELSVAYRVPGTTTALFGSGSYSVAIPSPAAALPMALAVVAPRRFHRRAPTH